jgi:hypothetical protein
MAFFDTMVSDFQLMKLGIRMDMSKKILSVQWVLLFATVAAIVILSTKMQAIKTLTPLGSVDASACYLRESRSAGCETSFLRLTSSPYSAQGRSIRLVGYLAIRNGVPLLFANEQDYLYDVVVNAIEIEGSSTDLAVLDGHWYSYVRAQGGFKLSKNTDDEPWFGKMQPPLRFNGVEAVKRENPNDLRISQGFLDQ